MARPDRKANSSRGPGWKRFADESALFRWRVRTTDRSDRYAQPMLKLSLTRRLAAALTVVCMAPIGPVSAADELPSRPIPFAMQPMTAPVLAAPVPFPPMPPVAPLPRIYSRHRPRIRSNPDLATKIFIGVFGVLGLFQVGADD